MTKRKSAAGGPDDVPALLVGEKAAARMIGVSAAMLTAGRFRKRPVMPFVRVGRRAIRYKLDDIEHFIDSNTECSPRNDGTLDKSTEVQHDR